MFRCDWPLLLTEVERWATQTVRTGCGEETHNPLLAMFFVLGVSQLLQEYLPADSCTTASGWIGIRFVQPAFCQSVCFASRVTGQCILPHILSFHPFFTVSGCRSISACIDTMHMLTRISTHYLHGTVCKNSRSALCVLQSVWGLIVHW